VETHALPQSFLPASQLNEQSPELHTEEPPGGALQGESQPPQWATSL
jgi:hypothetical protein